MIFNWFNKRMKKITDKINEQEKSAAQARQRLEENNKVRPPVSKINKATTTTSSRGRGRPVRSDDYAPYSGFNNDLSGTSYNDTSSSSGSSDFGGFGGGSSGGGGYSGSWDSGSSSSSCDSGGGGCD